MKKIICLLVATVFLMTAGLSWAQDKRGSAAMAKIMVENGEKYIKEHGLQAAIKEFNKTEGPFIKDDLYLTIIDFNGIVKANKNKAAIGKSRWDFQDPDGKYFVRELIQVAKAKGVGWVDFKHTHPKTKKTEQKTSYVKKVPGANMIIACGAYK